MSATAIFSSEASIVVVGGFESD